MQEGATTCFLIFLPTLVMGNFMVLNLFLALLLNSFNSEELKNRKEVIHFHLKKISARPFVLSSLSLWLEIFYGRKIRFSSTLWFVISLNNHFFCMSFHKPQKELWLLFVSKNRIWPLTVCMYMCLCRKLVMNHDWPEVLSGYVRLYVNSVSVAAIIQRCLRWWVRWLNVKRSKNNANNIQWHYIDAATKYVPFVCLYEYIWFLFVFKSRLKFISKTKTIGIFEAPNIWVWLRLWNSIKRSTWLGSYYVERGFNRWRNYRYWWRCKWCW